MKNKNSKRLDSIKAAHKVERTKSSSRMEDRVFFVWCPISLIVALLYFFSMYLPATIIGPPMAQVTPVGSGTQSIKNPIFWSFFPGAGALCSAPRDVAVLESSILVISE